MEKGSAIKELDDRVVGLRREIGKGRDTLAEFMTFQTFLYSLSPEHWRLQQEEKRSNGRYGVTHRLGGQLYFTTFDFFEPSLPYISLRS